jgi:hypothetical protein
LYTIDEAKVGNLDMVTDEKEVVRLDVQMLQFIVEVEYVKDLRRR